MKSSEFKSKQMAQAKKNIKLINIKHNFEKATFDKPEEEMNDEEYLIYIINKYYDLLNFDLFLTTYEPDEVLNNPTTRKYDKLFYQLITTETRFKDHDFTTKCTDSTVVNRLNQLKDTESYFYPVIVNKPKVLIAIISSIQVIIYGTICNTVYFNDTKSCFPEFDNCSLGDKFFRLISYYNFITTGYDDDLFFLFFFHKYMPKM